MTPKPVLRRRRADEDIEAAFAFYLNEAGPEVAADFVAELEKALQNISEWPAIGSPRYGYIARITGMRQWPVKGFPYLIFYLEKDRHIELSRVLHSSMDIPSRLDNVE